MSTIAEKLKIISDSCIDIKEAIVAKGGAISGDLTTYGDSIRGLQVGGDGLKPVKFDDKFHIYIDAINNKVKTSVDLRIKPSIDSGTVIEWGDGEKTTTVTTSAMYYSHTQAQSMASEIKIYSTSGSYTFNTSSSNFMFKTNPWLVPVQRIKMNNNATSIESYMFYNLYTVEQIDIPETVNSIGDYAFHGCKMLRTLDLSHCNRITSIPTQCFRYNHSLKHIKLPPNITTIGQYAFADCCSIQYISIPDTVKTISTYAFQGTSGLKVIDYGNTRTTVPPIPSNVLTNNNQLQYIVVPDAIYSNVSSSWDSTYKKYLIKWSDYQTILNPIVEEIIPQPPSNGADLSKVTVTGDSKLTLYSTNEIKLGIHPSNSKVEIDIVLENLGIEEGIILSNSPTLSLRKKDIIEPNYGTVQARRYIWQYGTNGSNYVYFTSTLTDKSTLSLKISGNTIKATPGSQATGVSVATSDFQSVIKGISESDYVGVYGIRYYNKNDVMIADYIPYIDNGKYCFADRISGLVYKTNSNVTGNVTITNDGLS